MGETHRLMAPDWWVSPILQGRPISGGPSRETTILRVLPRADPGRDRPGVGAGDDPRPRHDPGRGGAADPGLGAAGVEPLPEHPLGQLPGLGLRRLGDVHHHAVRRRAAGPHRGRPPKAPGRNSRSSTSGCSASRPGRSTTSSSTRWTRGAPRTISCSSRIAYGGEPRRITDGKSRNTSPKWSPSGELLAWSSNARNGRDMDLYVASPLDPHFTRRFKEVSGNWTVADWSPDEMQGRRRRVHLDQRVVSAHHRDGYRQDRDAHPAPDRCRGRTRLRRGSEVVEGWESDLLHHRQRKSNFGSWPRYDLDSGKEDHPEARTSAYDIEEFDLSPDGKVHRLVGEPVWNGSHLGIIGIGAELPRFEEGERGQRGETAERQGLLPAWPSAPARSSGSASRSLRARYAADCYSLAPRPANCQLDDSETGGLGTTAFAEPQTDRVSDLRRSQDPRLRLPPARRGSSPDRGRS